MSKIEKREILKTVIIFIVCIISILWVTPAQAEEIETQIYYKEGEKFTRSAAAILVKQGGRSNQQGFIAALKYIDPTGSEQPDKKKMTYCLDETKETPEGSMGRDEKGRLNKKILYCISRGVRYWGEEAVDEKYRTGLGFKGDYLATTFAVHVSNGEFTLEDLKDDDYCGVLGIPKRELGGSVWNSIVKMVEDAESSTMDNTWIPPNAAYDITPKTIHTWVPYTCKGVKGYRTEPAFHHTTGDVNNIRNIQVSFGENSKAASLIFLKNEELGVGASSFAADFQVFLPSQIYESMQRTGGSISAQIKGEAVQYYANWQYMAQNPQQQPSTYLEPVYKEESFTKIVEAVVERAYRKGTVCIEKKDKETGEQLEETLFTVFTWSKKAGGWVKLRDLTFSKEKKCYQEENLLETEDNEARFRIVETKAQEGYLNSGWAKEFDLYEQKKSDFSFVVTNTKEKPLLSVAKLADKTKGVKLVKGRYQGKKEIGEYETGEEVHYKMIVSNPGNVEIKEIHVIEEMSESLQKAIQAGSAKFIVDSSKEATTKSGKSVKITEINAAEVVVDHLESGDSLELLFKVKLQEEREQEEVLENIVRVEGSYDNHVTEGKIQTDADDKDEDDIKILAVSPPKDPVPPTKDPIPSPKDPAPPTKDPVLPTEELVPPSKEPVPPSKEPIPPLLTTVKTGDTTTTIGALVAFLLSTAWIGNAIIKKKF